MSVKRWLSGLAAAAALSCGGSTAAPTATTPTSPVNEVFASMLTAGGVSSHEFTMSQAGTITLTLQTVTPATAVGFGIGIPAGGPCSLTSSMVAGAGVTGQIALAADAGNYCAEIYDPGTVVQQVAFSMVVQHP